MNNSVHLGNVTLTFHRTCRVPRGKGRINALPASLGAFPVFAVRDLPKAPEHWHRESHVLPMYVHEAMWMGFNRPERPVALLIGAGMVNAVTGARLTESLDGTKQNYLAIPPQPWLDGFKRKEGESVYQFAAAKLGSGETAEEQILGGAEFGGLQFGLFDSNIPLIPASRPREYIESGGYYKDTFMLSAGFARSMRGPTEMGLGAGGAIRQKIYLDPYVTDGRNVSDVWSNKPTKKARVYIVLASDFKELTGVDAPPSPITFATYQQQGLPWFALPDGSWGDVEGSEAVDALKPVGGNPDPVVAGVPMVDPATEDLWK